MLASGNTSCSCISHRSNAQPTRLGPFTARSEAGRNGALSSRPPSLSVSVCPYTVCSSVCVRAWVCALACVCTCGPGAGGRGAGGRVRVWAITPCCFMPSTKAGCQAIWMSRALRIIKHLLGLTALPVTSFHTFSRGTPVWDDYMSSWLLT
jgi:hypothetical protein